MTAKGFLLAPLLAARGAPHGFGTRRAASPMALRRPVQVHGARVVELAGADAAPALGEADAVVSAVPGVPVGVVTADCVPVLLADGDARRVAAVHAGWRGLAAGVVEEAVAALGRQGARSDDLAAALGPHIGRCCYEVDAPVLEALRGRFGAALERAAHPARPGHARLDLGALAADALRRAGVPATAVDRAAAACTRCDPQRFHSHRRDGAAAGRLVHWIAARAAPQRP